MSIFQVVSVHGVHRVLVDANSRMGQDAFGRATDLECRPFGRNDHRRQAAALPNGPGARLRRRLQHQRLHVERLPTSGDGFDGDGNLAGWLDLQFAQVDLLEAAAVTGVGRFGLQRLVAADDA